jgi:hypothetical protein
MGVFDPLLESTTPWPSQWSVSTRPRDPARRPPAGSTTPSTPRSSGRLLQPPAVARADRTVPPAEVEAVYYRKEGS